MSLKEAIKREKLMFVVDGLVITAIIIIPCILGLISSNL
jgi:hypothetical protein